MRRRIPDDPEIGEEHAVDEWRWVDAFAEALGEPAVDREAIGAMLRLSRDVAHGVERKVAPVSTFVAGMHVGRRLAEGASPADALREVEAAASAALPEGD
jgi:hypothetical protein